MIENKNCQQTVTFLRDVPIFKDFELISKEDYHLGWLVYANGLCGYKAISTEKPHKPISTEKVWLVPREVKLKMSWKEREARKQSKSINENTMG